MKLRPLQSFGQQITFKHPLYTDRLQYYKSLRIYRGASIYDLFNNLMVNQATRYDFVVDNSMKFYKALKFIVGDRLSSFVVKNAIGRVFTGGSTIEELNERVLTKQNDVKYMIDYCSEALEDLKDPESFFDENSEMFKKTIMVTGESENKGNMIAIKVSGLCSVEFLRKLSSAQEKINHFVQKDTLIAQILETLKNDGLSLTPEQEQQFIQDILQRDSRDTMISSTEWRYRVSASYLYDQHKNQNPIIKFFNKFNQDEEQEFQRLAQRIDNFMKVADQLNVSVAVDAEQTYFQKAIDNTSEQLETKYNQNGKIIAVNTIQNYLKEAKERIEYEIEKATKFNRPIALKMVRGAYMVEESRLSKNNGYENPICDSYEETSNMYDSNVQKLMTLLDKVQMKMIIASHNENTIEQVKSFIDQTQGTKLQQSINFAQLYGLSNHVTYSLRDSGCDVFKYVPFGETNIMIPYLIRRAQESRKMLASNHVQTALLIDELKRRLFPSK